MADKDKITDLAERFGKLQKAPETAAQEQSSGGPLLSAIASLQGRMAGLEEKLEGFDQSKRLEGLAGRFQAATGGSGGAGQMATPGAPTWLAPQGAGAGPGSQPQSSSTASTALHPNFLTGGIMGDRAAPSMATMPTFSASPATLIGAGATPETAEPTRRSGLSFRADTGGLAPSPTPFPGLMGQHGPLPSALGSNAAMSSLLTGEAQQGGDDGGGFSGQPASQGGSASSSFGFGAGVAGMLSKGVSGSGGLGDREVLERLLDAIETLTEAMKSRAEGQEKRPGPQDDGTFVPGGPRPMGTGGQWGEVKSDAFPSIKTGIATPGLGAMIRAMLDRGP